MKLGIDLGGSHVAVALINEQNTIIAKLEENLTSEEKENIETAFIQKIIRNTEQLLKQENLTIEEIEKIGVACPRNNSSRSHSKSTEIWDYINSL